MNKQAYRIVFNQARGCLMAVAETVNGSGKGASGERTANPGGHGTSRGKGHAVAGLALACKLACNAVLVGLPLYWCNAVQAQGVNTRIVADTNTPATRRPTVLNSANGTVQVNIQTPSAAGVSRNTYSQFDVGGQGAILNNSRTDVPTQLGGWVQGNPWLATGSARVILNEVNSTSPSQLQGYVEVAGQRAQVVIANPAGIAVNGAGFINASGVTLTTGTPVISGGSLESYRVQRGSVSIDGAGLDTRNADYTANSINNSTGAIRADNNATLSSTGAGSVIGNSQGLISAGHTLTLQDTAASKTLAITNTGGQLVAGQQLNINSASLSGDGEVASLGDLELRLTQSLINTGQIVAEGSASLETAATLTNQATLAAGETLSATAATINNQAGATIQASTVQLVATDSHTLTNRGTINGGHGRVQPGCEQPAVASDRETTHQGTGPGQGTRSLPRGCVLRNPAQGVLDRHAGARGRRPGGHTRGDQERSLLPTDHCRSRQARQRSLHGGRRPLLQQPERSIEHAPCRCRQTHSGQPGQPRAGDRRQTPNLLQRHPGTARRRLRQRLPRRVAQKSGIGGGGQGQPGPGPAGTPEHPQRWTPPTKSRAAASSTAAPSPPAKPSTRPTPRAAASAGRQSTSKAGKTSTSAAPASSATTAPPWPHKATSTSKPPKRPTRKTATARPPKAASSAVVAWPSPSAPNSKASTNKTQAPTARPAPSVPSQATSTSAPGRPTSKPAATCSPQAATSTSRPATYRSPKPARPSNSAPSRNSNKAA